MHSHGQTETSTIVWSDFPSRALVQSFKQDLATGMGSNLPTCGFSAVEHPKPKPEPGSIRPTRCRLWAQGPPTKAAQTRSREVIESAKQLGRLGALLSIGFNVFHRFMIGFTIIPRRPLCTVSTGSPSTHRIALRLPAHVLSLQLDSQVSSAIRRNQDSRSRSLDSSGRS